MGYRSFARFQGLVALAVAAIVAAPASAHHSFNAYDMSRTLSASGTIKEFRWGAPHSSMVLAYVDEGGKPAEMSLVTGSPLAFYKQGFAPRDFHAGEKVAITFHPTANGAAGGVLASLTMNGKTYQDAEAAAAVSTPPGAPPQK